MGDGDSPAPLTKVFYELYNVLKQMLKDGDYGWMEFY